MHFSVSRSSLKKGQSCSAFPSVPLLDRVRDLCMHLMWSLVVQYGCEWGAAWSDATAWPVSGDLGEALRIDAYKIDQLAGFYGESFGITLSDSLEEKQTKFLEWAGAVRP